MGDKGRQWGTKEWGNRNMQEKPYHKLIIWQLANEFLLRIYKETKEFPREELYGLTSQLRRAALSVPTNIVEGYARRSRKELQNFLSIAVGSLAECEYLLEVARELNYITDITYGELENLRLRASIALYRFKSSMK